jgi:hypothetical protein
MKTHDIVTAIGVCARAADDEYDGSLDKQSAAWNDLRSAVFHLSELLEKTAKGDVEKRCLVYMPATIDRMTETPKVAE